MKELKRRIISLLIAAAAIILCWQIFAMLMAKPFIPAPAPCFRAFFGELAKGPLLKHGLVSLYRTGAALFASFALALPCGIIMGRSKKVDRLLTPASYILYPIPKVVFLPVIVVLFGLGDFPKIFLISLVLFFQLLIVVRDAAKQLEDEYIYSARALGMSNAGIITNIVLPLCVPQALSSLRVGTGTAIAILFFAESFASLDGLGYYISDMMSRRSYDRMFAGILAMSLLGLMLYAILYIIEEKLTGWAKDSHKAR